MRRLLLLAILLFPILMLGFWVWRGLTLNESMNAALGQKSVHDRLEEYGPAARARLKPFFATANLAYPPVQTILLGLKQEKVLEVYAAGHDNRFQFIRAYPILAASGVAGPKLIEGDLQVPEGIYGVVSLNPNSKYHLALRLGYPNTFDVQQAVREGRDNPGGDIMIHGGAASVGCLAMGDEAAEDLFVLAADTGLANLTVILSPVDFRKTNAVPGAANLPVWTTPLYETIKSNLNGLHDSK